MRSPYHERAQVTQEVDLQIGCVGLRVCPQDRHETIVKEPLPSWSAAGQAPNTAIVRKASR
jgi:hypothetical protein